MAGLLLYYDLQRTGRNMGGEAWFYISAATGSSTTTKTSRARRRASS